MSILLRPTPIGKRAEFILKDDADALVAAGDAVQCIGYDIYEAVTPDERAQGYMTRNMEAIPMTIKRGPGRPPKARHHDESSDAGK